MRIGILGGGQLSRMLALAGIPLGLDFIFYEPKKPCCAEKLGQLFSGHYEDTSRLFAFAEKVDVITYENENIPLETLTFLQGHRSVYPGIDALKCSQDRLLEKTLFQNLNIPTTPFIEVNTKSDLQWAASQFKFPFILKTRRLGYDGKGQIKINNVDELEKLNNPEQLQNTIAEQYIKFDREVSIIAVRSPSNEIKFYDLNENNHQNGILITTQNKPKDDFFPLAKQLIEKLLHHLNYVGVLALECFQVGNELLANEMAPRVHNSGHWTLEGAATSQFENHLRAILDWPLGETQSIGLATMANIIGKMVNKIEILKCPNVSLHDYQKEALPGRKLGHFTKVEFKR